MMMLEPVQGYVRDLSLGGIFVNTAMRFAAGDEIDLEISVRSGEPIRIKGEVVRVVQPIGAAIKFLESTPKSTLDRLDKLLKAEGKYPTGDI